MPSPGEGDHQGGEALEELCAVEEDPLPSEQLPAISARHPGSGGHAQVSLETNLFNYVRLRPCPTLI